jgi:hypothetical protein
MDLKLQRRGMRTSSEKRKALDRQHYEYLLLLSVVALTLQLYTRDSKDTMSVLLAIVLSMTRGMSGDTFRGKRVRRDLKSEREQRCTKLRIAFLI